MGGSGAKRSGDRTSKTTKAECLRYRIVITESDRSLGRATKLINRQIGLFES